MPDQTNTSQPPSREEFDALSIKIGTVLTKLDALFTNFADVKSKFDEAIIKLDDISTKYGDIKTKLGDTNTKFDEVKTKSAVLNTKSDVLKWDNLSQNADSANVTVKTDDIKLNRQKLTVYFDKQRRDSDFENKTVAPEQLIDKDKLYNFLNRSLFRNGINNPKNALRIIPRLMVFLYLLAERGECTTKTIRNIVGIVRYTSYRDTKLLKKLGLLRFTGGRDKSAFLLSEKGRNVMMGKETE